MNFCRALCNLSEYFRKKKVFQFQENWFVMRHFTKFPLSNIMKHCKSEVEQQINMQGIHLGLFLEKKKEAWMYNKKYTRIIVIFLNKNQRFLL